MKGPTPTASGSQTPAKNKASKAKAKAKHASKPKPKPATAKPATAKPATPKPATAKPGCCPTCGTLSGPASGDGSYMQIDRMMRIHEVLRLGKFPSQEKLARQLGFHRQTILTDVRFMQDRLNMPLAYNTKKRGWGYTQPMVEFPLLHITEQELMALCVAARALASFPGTPFAAIIRRVLEKFRFYIGDRLKFSLEQVEAALSFGAAAAPAVDSHVYEEMIAAALAGEEIECMYGKLNDGEPTKRVLQPVHVTARNGAWYLLAQNREKEQKIATFKLSRASEVRRTGNLFEKLPREAWEKPLADCIGIYLNVEPQRVRLCVTAPGVKLLHENPIHAKQEFATRLDGTTEVSLQIGITPELEARILSLGREARVLEPAILRDSLGDVGRHLTSWAEENRSGQTAEAAP